MMLVLTGPAVPAMGKWTRSPARPGGTRVINLVGPELVRFEPAGLGLWGYRLLDDDMWAV